MNNEQTKRMSKQLRGGDLIHAINKIIKSQIYAHNIDLSPNKKDRFSGAITMDLINEFEMINRPTKPKGATS